MAEDVLIGSAHVIVLHIISCDMRFHILHIRLLSYFVLVDFLSWHAFYTGRRSQNGSAEMKPVFRTDLGKIMTFKNTECICCRSVEIYAFGKSLSH